MIQIDQKRGVEGSFSKRLVRDMVHQSKAVLFILFGPSKSGSTLKEDVDLLEKVLKYMFPTDGFDYNKLFEFVEECVSSNDNLFVFHQVKKREGGIWESIDLPGRSSRDDLIKALDRTSFFEYNGEDIKNISIVNIRTINFGLEIEDEEIIKFLERYG